ncbi:hypothetical protein LPJ63_000706 [Coemansia sp. RSA 2711]|nr:hypothetical protein LPJ63_000706 [Coemansia sp. RSA 2711]KAJ2386674.1 hypothetical protein H4S02_003742 [Coemansia sp. RSA 2611]
MSRAPPQTPPRRAALGARADSLGPRTNSLGPRADSLGSPSRSPDVHRRLQRAHSQQAGDYHFSPRRKRPDDSPVSPRRMRRRLLFGDGARTDRRAAWAAALAVIREAVEGGDAHVDLSDLDLDAVPDELAELKDLVVLAPSHALVSDLQLTLSANALEHFPLAVCELANLTTLLLPHNRIAHVPPDIGNLRALRELSLADNRLRELPAELAALPRLLRLSVFPNPFDAAPAAVANDVLAQRLRAAHAGRALWPFRVRARDGGVPRLADLAARRLPRAELAALKQRLAQCVGDAAPPLGRIVGPAVEPADSSVLAALRAQHLALARGPGCAACGRWFLAAPVELTVWAPLAGLARAAPFRLRLCSRPCLYASQLAAVLASPA